MDEARPSEKSYIYKIAPSAPKPEIAASQGTRRLAVLPASNLDNSSGFIHMSTASQIPGTLLHFFQTSQDEQNTVFLLKVSLESLEERGVVRWESPDASICGPRNGEGMFPHLYFEEQDKSPRRLWLWQDEVDSIVEIVSQHGTVGWDSALEKVKSWLS